VIRSENSMRILSSLVLALLLAGCMGKLDVMVEREDKLSALPPKGEHAQTFFLIPGLDEAKAGRSSTLASDYAYGRLDAVIVSALNDRGFDRTLDAARADLVVHYSVFAREWQTTRSVPPPPLSQPPPGWDRLVDGAYNGSYSALEVEDHRAGTMVVDVVAADGGKLVHRFFIEGALTGDPKDNLTRAEEAIADGFEDFGEGR
jgi:hypothetical protein